MYVAIFVASIAAVIMFHEFGHFATAKLFGMKAERFFLGFGPTLWSTQRGETEYGVKAIPAGGFVKIAGMSPYEDYDPADRGRLFFEQPAWQRVIVLVAGSATHFVVAAALIFGGLWLVGIETGEPLPVVDEVVTDSPAARAGLEPGDRILAVAGDPVEDYEDASAAITARPGETTTLTVERDGRNVELTAEVAATRPDGSEGGFLGFVPVGRVERFGPVEALQRTWSGDYSVVRLTALTYDGLVQAFSPEALGRFFGAVGGEQERTLEDGGPSSLVGAGQLVDAVGESGDILAVLTILASLNIVLGTLNMLPLPPLDGGHVATLAVEETVNAVRRRRGRRDRYTLDPRVVTPIALAVIIFFSVLSLTAIYLDITQPLTDALG